MNMKLKQGHPAWRQKLAACVNDDIRPPTIQLSRSGHIDSIQQVCLSSDTGSFPLFSSLLFHSAKLDLPGLFLHQSRACSIPQCSYMEYKAPGHACLLQRWIHTNYIKATMTTSYLGSYFGYMLSTAKQNLVYIVWGGKLIFVKSVSRGDECKTICPVKAIHHSIKRQSRGKVRNFRQTWAIGSKEKTNWETRVDVKKRKKGGWEWLCMRHR